MNRFIVWVSISFAILNCSFAQASIQSQLSGAITVDGNPASNAIITLYLLNKEQSGYDKSISSKVSYNGLYRFGGLSDGNYVLTIMKEGKRVYQGTLVTSGQRNIVKNIDLTAFLFAGKWRLNLQKSNIPASYEMVDSTRSYSKKGDLITVLATQTFKDGRQTNDRYVFKCDGKEWVTGREDNISISCIYKYDGDSFVVEEVMFPLQYVRNELKNNNLIISTFKDRLHKQIISMFVFDPSN
jgi:hypothetical protein